MMPKCVWCNKENEQIKKITALTKTGFGRKLHEIDYFVCPEHEDKFRRFNDRVVRYAILFVSLMAIGLLGMVAPTIFHNNNWSGYLFVMSFAFLGLVLVLFPFCTPETIAIMGVAKSIKVAQIMGGVFFAIGAFVFVLALLYG